MGRFIMILVCAHVTALASLAWTATASATCPSCGPYDYGITGSLTDQRDQAAPSIVLSLTAKAGPIGHFVSASQAVDVTVPSGAVATSVQADYGSCSSTGNEVHCVAADRKQYSDDVHIDIVVSVSTAEPLEFRASTINQMGSYPSYEGGFDVDHSDNQITLTAPLFVPAEPVTAEPITDVITPPITTPTSRIVLRRSLTAWFDTGAVHIPVWCVGAERCTTSGSVHSVRRYFTRGKLRSLSTKCPIRVVPAGASVTIRCPVSPTWAKLQHRLKRLPVSASMVATFPSRTKSTATGLLTASMPVRRNH